MNIADRIQHLRKTKGISQEELADRVGVSRQAVSKWESEQSMPDLDKIITMSEYFEVTTDYLLRGIESPRPAEEKKADARIFVIVATVLDLIGLLVAVAVWYEKQVPMAIVIGLVFMALGCMVFGVGLMESKPGSKAAAKYNFWTVNIWLLLFLPLSCLANLILTGIPAPYPMLITPLAAFVLFWLVYLGICLTVVFFCLRQRRAK